MKGKLIFEEIQSFRYTWSWWLVIISTVGIAFPLSVMFLYGIYQQEVTGVPFGDKPAPSYLLFLFFLLNSAIFGGIYYFVDRMKLTVRLDEGSITYKFFPIMKSFKKVEKRNLKSTEVKKYRPIAEYGGWGYRMNLSGRKKAYNITGNMGLEIQYLNGNKLMLGTQKPIELTKALNRLNQAWERRDG